MRFVWDPEKNARNFAERGFDFEFASTIFTGWTLEVVDQRREYGERRTVAVGRADGFCLTVVYTDRFVRGRRVCRIISARRSSRDEREAYEEALAGE